MNSPSQLRSLRVAGPPLADRTPLWEAAFDVDAVPATPASAGAEGVVRNFALRSLSQKARPRALHVGVPGQQGEVPFHDPTLIDADVRLVANGRNGRGWLTIAGAAEQVVTEGPSCRVRLVPIGAWPAKATPEVEVPPMRMVGGEIRVPVRAGGRLADALGLARGPWTAGGRVGAFGPDSGMTVSVAAGRGAAAHVWITLVAEGVRLEVQARDPFGGRFGDDPGGLGLTVTMRPGRVGTALELEVSGGTGEGALRARVATLARALGATGPLRLSVRPGVVPLAWPLVASGASWRATSLRTTIAGDHVRASLLTKPPAPGLPPQVAEVRPESVGVDVTAGVLTATLSAGAAAAGTACTLAWTPGGLRLTALRDEAGDAVTVFAETTALRAGLLQRYVAQGLRATDANTPVHAFIPLARGFLQAALPTPPVAGEGTETVAAGGSAFVGEVRVDADGWTAVIDSAAGVTVSATLGVTLAHVDVALSGARGQADGLLWTCATAPGDGDVLPSLAAGPAALEPVPCLIGRRGASGFPLVLSSSGAGLRATLGAAEPPTPDPPLVVWLAHPTLALAQAMPMTRFAPGPSTTRDLAPRVVAYGATIVWPPGAGWPMLDLATLRPALDAFGQPVPDPFDWPWPKRDKAEGEAVEDDAVPMIVVTLPGLEASPDPTLGDPFATTFCSMRFDLVASGELSARAALSEDAESDRAPQATALDPEGLSRAFARQARLLALTRTMGDRATDWVPIGGVASPVTIRDLVRPAAWTTTFQVVAAAPGGPPLGAYKLGDGTAPWWAGAKALRGFKGPVSLDDGNTVDVVGLTVALREEGDERIDARGHGFASRPDLAAGLALREIRGEGGAKLLLLTSSTLEVTRGLALVARDLPVKRAGDALTFDEAMSEAAGELLPSQDGGAFRRRRFAAALMEWRLFDPVASPPTFTIPLGPLLRIRPLRLVAATIAADGAGVVDLTIAAIVGMSRSTDADPVPLEPDAPFRDDDPYAAGSMIRVTWNGGKLSAIRPAAAGGRSGDPGPVRVEFPIQTHGPDGGTSLVLVATLGVSAGEPALSDVTLQGRLFGAATVLTGGAWTTDGISFPFPTPAGAAARTNALTVRRVEVGSDPTGRWELRTVADARIGLQKPGAAPSAHLVALASDGTHRLFDADLPSGGWTIDHDLGTVIAEGEFGDVALGVARGLALDHAAVSARVVLALAVPDGIVTRTANHPFDIDLSSGLAVFDSTQASLTLRLSSASGLVCEGDASISIPFGGRDSRIGWPIGTLNSAAGASTLTVSNDGAALAHRITPNLDALTLPLERLRREPGGTLFVDLSDGPWLARVTCRHEVLQGGATAFGWSSLEEVAIFDWRSLRAALGSIPPRQLRAHAFAPRYKDDALQGDRIASAGIVERSLARGGFPPFALAGVWTGPATKDVRDCLIVSGASLCDMSFADGQGLTLALPWFAPLEDGADAGALAVPQAPTGGRLTISVSTPDATPWRPSAVAPPIPIDPGSGNAADVSRACVAIGASSADAMLGDPAFASDARDVPVGERADATQQTAERPVFVRNLIALAALVSLAGARGAGPDCVVLLDGVEAPLRVEVRTPRRRAPASVRELIALSRRDWVTETSEGEAARQALRLTRRPLATVVATRDVDGPLLYREADARRAPQVDDGGRPPRRLRAKATWTGGSPAQGWPTEPPSPPAATTALAIGAETPIQDEAAVWAGRGRLVASARRAAPKGHPAFLTFGRRTLFSRPDGVALRAPPDGTLTPAPPRVRAPTADALVSALRGVGVSEAAPVLPGAFEIVESGGRPGVLGLDLQGLVQTGDAPSFDARSNRFGRPAHRGAMLASASRVPRSGPYGPGADLATRRRTFAAENYRDGGEPALGIAAQGAMTLLRATESSFKTGGGTAWTGVCVRCKPADMVIDERWGGTLTLWASAPGVQAGELRGWLALLGLRAGARAALTVGAERHSFATLSTAVDQDLRLTLVMDEQSAAKVRQSLVEAAPDTRLGLSLRFAPPGVALDTADDQQTIALRRDADADAVLPVGPPVVLSLPLQRARAGLVAPRAGLVSLVFGDPAYDRDLGSATKAARVRVGAGTFLLALDRAEYDRTATMHLAVGPIGTDAEAPPRFVKNSAGEWLLSMRLVPAPRAGTSQATNSVLVLAGVEEVSLAPPPNGVGHRVAAGLPVALPLPALRAVDAAGKRRAVDVRQGDRIVLTASRKDLGVELTVEVGVSAKPEFAAPDAVYAAVGLDTAASAARTMLFASAPMPDAVEFLDLAGDLATGRVRRRALFVWRMVRTAPLTHVAVVKLDAVGGGQMPDGVADFLPVLD